VGEGLAVASVELVGSAVAVVAGVVGGGAGLAAAAGAQATNKTAIAPMEGTRPMGKPKTFRGGRRFIDGRVRVCARLTARRVYATQHNAQRPQADYQFWKGGE
jgi:hypothetical protein